MNFNSIDELKAKLTEISKMGFIKSHRKDNTGIGKTLEDVMDITENNLATGDFKISNVPVELKAQRKKASSRVTLSTKEPEWMQDKLDTILKTGYKDKQGRQGLKITLNTLKFNAKGYMLETRDGKIAIVHNKLGEVCFFKVKELIEIIKAKIGENLLLVLADVQKKDEDEYFNYVEAIYFSKFDEEMFKQFIAEGKIIWEFRLHLKPSGAIRDHGSGFRIGRRYLPNLFKDKSTLLSSSSEQI